MQKPEFFDQWSLYNKILEKDYMFHSKIFQQIQKIINLNFLDKKYSLLDIGCGEAYGIYKLLDTKNLANYLGIDKSQDALQWAQKNLKKSNFKVSLLRTDFEESFDLIPDEFDILLCGYSVHHLKTQSSKRNFIGKLIKKLPSGGILIFFDLVRRENETMSQYHNRYFKFCKLKWGSMTGTELSTIKTHIQNSDFPLTERNWKETFCPKQNNLRVLLIDNQNPYYLLIGFQKN